MAEQLNLPRNNRQKRDAELLDSKPLDSKPLDSKALDSKPLDSKPLDSKALDSKLLGADKSCLEYSASEAKDLDIKGSGIKGADIVGDTAAYVACALYKFVALSDFQALRGPLLQQMRDHQVFGTLLLAQEGINGTIAGTQAAIDRVLAWLAAQPGLDGIEVKQSFHHEIPFYRAKVKLKREIVTMGVEGIDPQQSAGTYIEPEQWNALISDPDVLVVDTRNDYEVKIGSFANAVDPQTTNFRDFPAWVDKNLHPGEHKKVAMFCTGGIRCEKSTAYLKERGFGDVYHLRGGILNYLKKVPQQQSLWQGECFVFDNRVAVDHALQRGSYDQCHACRMPITEEDKTRTEYLEGRACHHCVDHRDSQQQQRANERQKQVSLAKLRGEEHIGDAAAYHTERRRLAKKAQKNLQKIASKAAQKDQ